MPSTVPLRNGATAQDYFEDNLNLSILGLGAEYPPYRHGPGSLNVLAERFYKPSTALTKVLSINRFTGIEQRASIGDVDHSIVNQPTPPSIKDLNGVFREDGVRISVGACKQAIREWGGDVKNITHMVSTTCTNSANPGFDHYVRKELGVKGSTENVLLHGIGCSGGLAAVRTACNLALGASYRKKPARILVVACELSTPLFRSELDSVDKDQSIRIGVCLFSDGASACIITNNVGEERSDRPAYDILGWKHGIIEDSEQDLGFDVDPHGWKVVLTPRVPTLTCDVVGPAFRDLVQSIPSLSASSDSLPAKDFDWALHPGGSTIITGIQKAMGITEDQLRATYEIYMNYGNSSSATILSVMNKLRNLGEGRENVVACAFGPGISMEMMILRRRRGQQNGDVTNGDTTSVDLTNVDIMNGLADTNSHTEINGKAEDRELMVTNGVSGTHDVPIEDVD